jgi:hypothetical protein
MSDFIAKWSLGYKETGENEAGLLGWEKKVTDAIFEDGSLIEVSPSGVDVVWCVNTGSGPITPGRSVKLDAGEELLYSVETVTSSSDWAFGVADPYVKGPIAVGEKFNVVRSGPIPVRAGANLDKGDYIGVSNTGAAIESDNAFGYMLESVTSGNLGRAYVEFKRVPPPPPAPPGP